MTQAASGIEIVSLNFAASTVAARIENRFSHAFIYKEDGESFYDFGDKQFAFAAGNVLYIPEGSSYSFRKVSEGDSHHRLLNFHAEGLPFEEPKIFAINNCDAVVLTLRQLEHCWRFGSDVSSKYEVLSLFYRLISLILKSEEGEYTTSEKKELIAPAIKHLEENLFSTELKISDLYRLCEMSAPTFRHIFMSKFGTSPKSYVINQRIARARTILRSGEYQSIAEVAAAVGYKDPLYFSKHFRELTGSPPSHYLHSF